MIELIHGEDSVASRNYLLKLKEGKNKFINLDARILGKEKLWQSVNQSSLFEDGIIIIDWFEEKYFEESLKNTQRELVIWSAQTLKDTQWANKVSVFPIHSVNFFKLTDAFGLRKASAAQQYLDLTLADKTSPELILSLLSRQLKQISWALCGNVGEISKSSFVQKKISDQAGLWSEKAVKRAYRALLEADLAIKSGLDSRLILSLAIAKSNP